MSTTEPKKGIDVSAWQGSIDWTKTKNDGIQYAVIRAGYGRYISQKDDFFEANYAEAKAAGVPVGAYWYTYATTVDRAKEEAETCLEAIAGKEFDLPIYFDIEYEAAILALTTTERTAICRAFCEAIEAAGYKPGIYCSTDFATNKLSAADLSEYTMWIAQYAGGCSYAGSYDMWQYSSSGQVAGISGNVDMDYLYADLTGGSGKTDSSGASAGSTQESQLLDIDGIIGTRTVTRWQEVEGTIVDGWISGQTAIGKERWPAVSSTVCAWTGSKSQLVAAWQNFLIKKGYNCGSAGADGKLGKDTATATQNFLIKKGYSCGSAGADGYIGPDSAKALQRWLNSQM